MKKFFNLILFVLILLMFVNINMVLATDSAQIQSVEQNVEQSVDKTKTVDSMGIYQMPDDLTYSDSSKIYLRNGIIVFKFDDGSYQLVDMMSTDIIKSANFQGDTDNIIINFSYNNVMINGSVILQKSTDTVMHNTLVGDGADNSIVGFDIKVAPKYSYLQNYDNLSLKNGVLEVFYKDGSLGIVKMTDPEVVVEGFDNRVPGIQVLTVKYKGAENTFKVNIVEKRKEANLEENKDDNQNKFSFQEYKTIKTNDNNSSNNNGNTNKNVISKPNGPDNTMAKGLLPQTGDIYIYVVIILGLIILGIVAYIKEVVIKKGIRGK